MHIRRTCLTVICLATIAAGCSGGGSSNTAIPSTAMQLSGSIGDGPVVNADLRVVDANGKEIATTTSDSGARYAVDIPAGTPLPVTVYATGGTDLVTGRALDFELASSVSEHGRSIVNVSPITTLQYHASDCIASDSSLREAKQQVTNAAAMGLELFDSQFEAVTAENVAAVVKANEALGEVIRRSAALLPDSTGDDVVAQLGCDLADGAIDGSGRSTPAAAAVLHAVIANVMLETISNQLLVDGTDATARMNDAIAVIEPDARIMIEDVLPSKSSVELLQTSLTALKALTSTDDLLEIQSLLARTPYAELPAALADLSPAARQTLNELPMAANNSTADDVAQVALAALEASQTPAPMLSFSTSAASVAAGGTVTLSWSTSNADECVATGGWSGSQDLEGAHTSQALNNDASFQLTCFGAGGVVSSTTDVLIADSSVGTPSPTPTPTPGAVNLTFGASSQSITSGSATTLSWSATNANSCSASGDWSGNLPASGSQSTGNLTSNASYTLTCTGAGGEQSATVAITVAPVAAGVSVNLTPNDSWLNRSGSTSLRWSSTNASSCTASGAWAGAKSLSGTQSTGSLLANGTYILSCTNGSSNAVAIAQVSIRQAKLSWAKPSSNSDGTPLTDLRGYKIFWGTTSGSYANELELSNPNTTSRVIELDPGTHYFNMKSLNTSGAESAFSGELSKAVE